MSPHQTATKIAAKFLGCPEEQAAGGQLASQICDAIQAASNEELNCRRERVAALEAALTFYSKHEHWMAITGDADCLGTLLIANGRNRKNGHGWEEADAALSGSTSALTAAIADATAKAPKPWRCFHCGFETVDPKEAEAHFGEESGESALCLHWESLGPEDKVRQFQGLLMELNGERDDNAVQRQRIEGLEYQVATVEADIASRFKGCRTINEAWCKLDSMEGRALVAEEARAKLTEERDALAALGLCWQPIATFKARRRRHGGEKVLLLPLRSEVPVLMAVLPEDYSFDFKDHADTYYTADRFEFWMPMPSDPKSPNAKNFEAILAARDARIRAEGRRAGLLEAAGWCRKLADRDSEFIKNCLEDLAGQTGEAPNAD